MLLTRFKRAFITMLNFNNLVVNVTPTLQGFLLPGPPAARSALDDVGVVEQAVEHGGDGGGVAE